MGPDSAVDPAWQRVAELINERLQELGWTQTELVRASGVSPTTIRFLQQGGQMSYRSSTLTKVARALGWPAMAIEHIRRDGRMPEPILDPLDPNGKIVVVEGNHDVAVLEALAGAERLSPDRRAKLVGYLEALLDDQDADSTK